MANNKSKQPKKNQPNIPQGNKSKPKISFMWIYFALLLLFLLIWQFGTEGQYAKEVSNTTLSEMVENREINYLQYVRKNDRIDIFLKKSAIEKNSNYKEIKDNGNFKGPQYFINTTDYQVFNEDLKEMKKSAIEKRLAQDSTLTELAIRDDYNFDIKQDTSRKWGGDILWIGFSIIFFVFIFMQIRAMRGGGGG